MSANEFGDAGSGTSGDRQIASSRTKKALVGAGARILFYPTLVYNVVRNKMQAEFRWWDEIDQVAIFFSLNTSWYLWTVFLLRDSLLKQLQWPQFGTLSVIKTLSFHKIGNYEFEILSSVGLCYMSLGFWILLFVRTWRILVFWAFETLCGFALCVFSSYCWVLYHFPKTSLACSRLEFEESLLWMNHMKLWFHQSCTR